MSRLSSRVMNMKFMQSADTKDAAEKEIEVEKKVKDESEWVLPNASIIAKKVNISTPLDQVGYGSINEFLSEGTEDTGSPQITRRKWDDVDSKKESLLSTTTLKSDSNKAEKQQDDNGGEKQSKAKKRKSGKLDNEKVSKHPRNK